MNVAPATQFRFVIYLVVLTTGFNFAPRVTGQDSVVETPLANHVESPPVDTELALMPSVVAPIIGNGTLTELPIVQAMGQMVNTLTTCGGVIPVCILPQDDVWLISARESHLAPCDLSRLQCSRLQNGQWNDAPLDELVAQHSTDKTKVTMIYAHGNRTELKWAQSRGLQFYKNSLYPMCRPAVRYVIFAWKSEAEVPRVLSDFKIKSDRSVVIGTTFGKLLGQFHDRQIVLAGFSLGAQVVLQGVSDPELQNVRYGRYRVAIFAPALNPCFVQAGLADYPNNPIVQKTDVFRNRDDRAVKASQLIARKRTHAYVSTLSQLANTSGFSPNAIRIHDITAEVIRRHSIVKYSESPRLNRQLSIVLNEPFEHPVSQ